MNDFKILLSTNQKLQNQLRFVSLTQYVVRAFSRSRHPLRTFVRFTVLFTFCCDRSTVAWNRFKHGERTHDFHGTGQIWPVQPLPGVKILYTVSVDSMNVHVDEATHRGIFTLVWRISCKVLNSTVHFWQFQVLGIICVSDEQNTTQYDYHWHSKNINFIFLYYVIYHI